MANKLSTRSILDILNCDLSDFEDTSTDDEDSQIQEDLLYKGIYFVIKSNNILYYVLDSKQLMVVLIKKIKTK